MDAQKWRQSLRAKGLAEATVAKRVKIARQLFKAAMRWSLLASSPFAEVKTGSQKNKARQFFVPLEDYEKLVNACDSVVWKIRFALCRFGGLRMPSETERLKWSDVDWASGRFKVTSPKTERYVGGESRLVPLFPELRAIFEQVPRNGPHILGEVQKTNAALRTQALKIFAKAGVQPWPRLFQNMRLSRQTELAARHPAHVVCAWMGNSEVVARDHYLIVTDDDFKRAAGAPNIAPAAEKV